MDAIKALNEMAPLNVLFAEQPVGREDPMLMAQVKQATSIPVMVDESVFTLAEALAVVRESAADVISLHPGKNGSVIASCRVAQIAKSAGIVCHVGSNLELEIATAIIAHLAVAKGRSTARLILRIFWAHYTTTMICWKNP